MSIQTNVARIIKKAFPSLFLRGTFEFRIVAVIGDRFVLQPVRAAWLDTIGSPSAPIGVCDLWPGSAGHSAEPKLGSSVVISYLDAIESNPVAVGFAPRSSPLGTPDSITHDAVEIKLGNAASDHAASAEDLYALFAATFGAWTPVTGDGGAALQALWATWFIAHPLTPGGLGASKVRIE